MTDEVAGVGRLRVPAGMRLMFCSLHPVGSCDNQCGLIRGKRAHEAFDASMKTGNLRNVSKPVGDFPGFRSFHYPQGTLSATGDIKKR